MKTGDPRKVLDALLQGAAVDGHDAADVTRARTWAASPDTAEAAGLERLPEPLALAVLEGAVRARSHALPTALLESGNKALAKAAKRALYQLRSLGVSVPEKSAPASPPSAPAAAPPEELIAMLSPVTGGGERAVLVPRAVRGGGLEIFQVVISDERGILQLGGTKVSRSTYRRQLAELRGGGVMELPARDAVALLCEAAALNVASRTSFPEGAEEPLRLLGVSPSAGTPLTLPPPGPDDVGLTREGHYLHNEPEVLGWLPPEDELKHVARKMDEVIHSPLQLSDAQRNEQVLAVFHSAARAFFTEPMRHLYARRLWAMAEYFERTGRERPAQLARAEARRLFHGALEPYSRFAEFLFEKVLLLSQRAQQQGGEGLPAPGTGAPLAGPVAPQPPAERRSPGGLILP